mmetsp:Transcript_19975/g.33270  ORF Transcript_19975/g.33270 Transcript_19975/m.33270 type:complete len:194 (-) Transcript_19975:704-1285(-)
METCLVYPYLSPFSKSMSALKSNFNTMTCPSLAICNLLFRKRLFHIKCREKRANILPLEESKRVNATYLIRTVSEVRYLLTHMTLQYEIWQSGWPILLLTISSSAAYAIKEKVERCLSATSHGAGRRQAAVTCLIPFTQDKSMHTIRVPHLHRYLQPLLHPLWMSLLAVTYFHAAVSLPAQHVLPLLRPNLPQ